MLSSHLQRCNIHDVVVVVDVNHDTDHTFPKSATMIAVKQLRIRDSAYGNVGVSVAGAFVPTQEASLEKIEQEIELGLSMHHPHICKYLGAGIQTSRHMMHV
jgi:hypothetical protein